MSTQTKSPQPKGKRRVCVFCEQGDVCEETYGKLLTKAGVTAHYFCMLFSSGLSQNGKTEKQGILGFLQSDIMKEVKRGARLRCSYCRKIGATIGCVIRNCKKMFHLGCGRSNKTMHQFFGTFSSFCPAHRQQQDVPSDDDPNIVCSICMNTVTAAPCNDTIRSPCCRKYWYHRECVQRYATSAGLYFFKCPLCNNKEEFQDEMLTMGIYIPDQDASWEKEPHAFQELLERYGHCDAPVCKCVEGRKYDKEGSKWEIILCDFCGSHGAHVACNHLEKLGKHDICHGCKEVDEKTREEEYLLHSPPHKRKSLELLQLELASSPEASKGTSPYPGPSNSMKKLGLPNSPTGNAKTKVGAKKGKRMASQENEACPPKLKKQRSRKASATVTSVSARGGTKETLLSPNTSSQSSEDSSDDDVPFSILKSKLQKMKLENAWDVRRRKRMESQRKHAEKKQKKTNNVIESDSDVEVKRKVLDRKNKKWSLLDSEMDTSTETIDKKGNNKKSERKVMTLHSESETDAELIRDSVNLNSQKNCNSNKRLSLAVTNSEKGKEKTSQSRMSLAAWTSSSTNSNAEKKKHGKLKKRSVENDRSQTTLTGWLKPKPKYENEGIKSSPEKAVIDVKKGDKKPIVIEWKGKQLIIRSPRVALNRSRSRKVIKMKPKCLEIDMNDRKGSLDSNKDIDLLSNLETDIRVTRKMVDIDQHETKAAVRNEKPVNRAMLPARDAQKEENTETKITSRTKLPKEENINWNSTHIQLNNKADKSIKVDVNANSETSNTLKLSDLTCQGISREKPVQFDNSIEKVVDKRDESQFKNDREDSPAKNLRVRKTKEDTTNVVQTADSEGCGLNILKKFRNSPGKNIVSSKPVFSPKLAVKTESPAKHLRSKKDQLKTNSLDTIDVSRLESPEKEDQHTPTMQNKSCFNFTVVQPKISGEKGSPLIRVKESAEWGSVILINDTSGYKDTEIEENGMSDNNIERLRMYKPALPVIPKLEDSPAKNLRKRSYQVNKIPEKEKGIEVNEVKEAEQDKVKELEKQSVDSDSDNVTQSDQLERLKKYKPKVNYLNSANTTDVIAGLSDVSVLDKVQETAKNAPNSPRYMNKRQDNAKEQQSVVWHLEGTRQLQNGINKNDLGVHGAGCENTCPNPQPTSKVDPIQEEQIKTSTVKARKRGFSVSDILGEKLTELNGKLPATVPELYPQSELCNTADNLSPSYFTKFRRSCSKSESLESFSSKASSSDNDAAVKSATSLHDNQGGSIILPRRNILNGVKNSSACKQRSSPRSVKKDAMSHAMNNHMSDKLSMAEYYGATLGTDQNEKINGAGVDCNNEDDDDDDIVELPLFIGTGSVL